jgi:FkbM family methyltransferase
VLEHYWSERLPVTYIDVGCKYGTGALVTALYIADRGYTNRVIAFEPGLAAGLVEANIRLNGMEGHVTFERMAVSDTTGLTIMFGESGHTENCRIVNRDVSTETDSWVVDTVSLDDYLAQRGVDGHLVVKIDTQGAEWQVIQGMQRALAERLVTYLTEFTPWAIGTTIDPVEFLIRIGEGADLVEMASAHRLIRPADYTQFAAAVDATPGRYTDILVIPARLPGRDRLLGCLLA